MYLCSQEMSRLQTVPNEPDKTDEDLYHFVS